MNYLRLAVLLFFLPAATFAADAVHWYGIAVGGTVSERTFTGSSAFDAEEIVRRLAFADPIVLENLRVAFQGSWHPNVDVLKMYIPTKAILYFSELPGDPAAVKVTK